LLAKVRRLGINGAVGNITNIRHINVVITDITAKLHDLQRHLSQVEDRVHTANSMNTANRLLIIHIQVVLHVNSHTRLRALGMELIPVSWQSACR